jgi:hypothetical protein
LCLLNSSFVLDILGIDKWLLQYSFFKVSVQ